MQPGELTETLLGQAALLSDLTKCEAKGGDRRRAARHPGKLAVASLGVYTQ